MSTEGQEKETGHIDELMTWSEPKVSTDDIEEADTDTEETEKVEADTEEADTEKGGPAEEDDSKDASGTDTEETTEEAAEEEQENEEQSTEGDEVAPEKEPGQGVPMSRLAKVARERTVLQSIADGLVDGAVDGALISDMGGSKAVARAISRGELSLNDVASTDTPKGSTTNEEQSDGTDEAWTAYHKGLADLVDADELAVLFNAAREADKAATEAVVSSKIEESVAVAAQKTDFDNATVIFNGLQDQYPEMKDADSDDYQDFITFYNGALANGASATAAVNRAAKRVLGVGITEPNKDVEQIDKSAEVAAKRKTAAVKKNIEASKKQPADTSDMAGNKFKEGRKNSELGEDDWNSLSEKERTRRLHGG